MTVRTGAPLPGVRPDLPFLLKNSLRVLLSRRPPSKGVRVQRPSVFSRTRRGCHGSVTTGPIQGVGRGLHRDPRSGGSRPRASLAPTLARLRTADRACESGPERLPILLPVGGAPRWCTPSREDRQHRGRCPSPHKRGTLCPKGGGDLPAPREPEPRNATVLHRAWRARPSGRHGISIAPRWTRVGELLKETATRRRRATSRTARGQLDHGHSHSGGGPPSTTSGTHIQQKAECAASGCVADRDTGRILNNSSSGWFPGWGTAIRRGAATCIRGAWRNSDCVVIQGSNMAECHRSRSRWPMQPSSRGAKLIHVDPAFTRTSAMPTSTAPIPGRVRRRVLGGLIHHVLRSERWNGDPLLQGIRRSATPTRRDRGETSSRTRRTVDGVFSGLMRYTPGIKDVAARYIQASSASTIRGPWGYATAARPPLAAPPPARRFGRSVRSCHSSARRDETLQHPHTVFQIVKTATSPIHARDGQRRSGCPKETFLQVEETILAIRAATARLLRVRRGLDPAHQRPRRHRMLRACLQLLLGTHGRPGAA